MNFLLLLIDDLLQLLVVVVLLETLPGGLFLQLEQSDGLLLGFDLELPVIVLAESIIVTSLRILGIRTGPDQR